MYVPKELSSTLCEIKLLTDKMPLPSPVSSTLLQGQFQPQMNPIDSGYAQRC